MRSIFFWHNKLTYYLDWKIGILADKSADSAQKLHIKVAWFWLETYVIFFAFWLSISFLFLKKMTVIWLKNWSFGPRLPKEISRSKDGLPIF